MHRCSKLAHRRVTRGADLRRGQTVRHEGRIGVVLGRWGAATVCKSCFLESLGNVRTPCCGRTRLTVDMSDIFDVLFTADGRRMSINQCRLERVTVKMEVAA